MSGPPFSKYPRGAAYSAASGIDVSDKMALCALTALTHEGLPTFFFFLHAFVNLVGFGASDKSSFSGVMFFPVARGGIGQS